MSKQKKNTTQQQPAVNKNQDILDELSKISGNVFSSSIVSLFTQISAEFLEEGLPKPKKKFSKNWENQAIEIHELLPNYEIPYIYKVLEFVGDKEAALDMLLNGVHMEFPENQETSSQQSKAAPEPPKPSAYAQELLRDVEREEMEYFRQAKRLKQLTEDKIRWQAMLGTSHETSSQGAPTEAEAEGGKKSHEGDWVEREKKMIEKRLREERMKRNTYFYCEGEVEAISSKKVKRYSLGATSVFDCEAEQIHFRICESQFHRFMSTINYNSGYANYVVESVEYIVTPEHIRKFNQAKIDLAEKHGFMVESMKPILLFHGTSEQNMENILKTNFLVEKIGSTTDMGYYGKGFYFSEYPGLSISYSRGNPHLLICLGLVGKAFKMANVQTGCALTQGYDSHISPEGSEVVIFRPECVLPCYKIKWAQQATRTYSPSHFITK